VNIFPTAYAAETTVTAQQLIQKIEVNIFDPLIKLGFAIAVIYFLYGVYEVIKGEASSEARAKGAQHVLWGTIGIAIMVAVYGIIWAICGTFNLSCGG